MTRLTSGPRVARLARDLGMVGRGEPVGYLIRHCREWVDRLISEFEPTSLQQLLETVTAKLGLLIEVIDQDADLASLVSRYLAVGEGGFARVRDDFAERTFALVLRLRKPHNGCAHVAVIDCRGSKASRKWFSIWHEIAHLLVEPQLTLDYRRTGDAHDEVERVMDAIAGELAFHPRWFDLGLGEGGRPALRAFEALRLREAPTASLQTAYLTLVTRLRTPALLLIAELALKESERRSVEGGLPAMPLLRAVFAIGSPTWVQEGLYIPKTMRVPERSVIFRVHGGAWGEEHLAAEEDLDWWESQGKRLRSMPLWVEAASVGQRVVALITPRT